MELEPEPEPELFKSRNRNHNFFKSRNRNRNQNFSKVGTGTGTGTVKNSYGSTTLVFHCTYLVGIGPLPILGIVQTSQPEIGQLNLTPATIIAYG